MTSLMWNHVINGEAATPAGCLTMDPGWHDCSYLICFRWRLLCNLVITERKHCYDLVVHTENCISLKAPIRVGDT